MVRSNCQTSLVLLACAALVACTDKNNSPDLSGTGVLCPEMSPSAVDSCVSGLKCAYHCDSTGGSVLYTCTNQQWQHEQRTDQQYCAECPSLLPADNTPCSAVTGNSSRSCNFAAQGMTCQCSGGGFHFNGTWSCAPSTPDGGP
jgi:hypothetical protein